MTVNTKQSERRELKYNSIADIERDLDVLQAANTAGTIATTGNWSAGQNLEHCAKVWRAGIDGFPPEMKPPMILKMMCKVFFKKKAISGATPPAGIKLPKEAKPFLPDDDVTFEQGMADFRTQIERTKSGEKFTAVSPLFGVFTHDEWQQVQLGHTQLHLGFVQVG